MVMKRTLGTVITLVMMARQVHGGFSCVSNPCHNGICIDHLNSSYSCYCIDGYTGMQCQTNWDECWSAPCMNGATCVDLVADLSCLCAPGYTGEYCESEINECLSNPCQNNGTCEDLLDHYLCVCPLGYSGDNCEIDISVCNNTGLYFGEAPKCQNGGKCIDGPGLSYHCLCPPGWQGRWCEKDVDECLTSPCYNAGVCLNTPGSFACACQFGYTGDLCEEAVVFCEDSPCANGALCVMENNNATCYCVPDYHGSKCHLQYNDCLPYAPRCMNGGTCIDGVDSFRCSCPNSASGELCQCVTTSDGLDCDPLPSWYDGKPFEPIDDTKGIFPHWFNVSKPKNDTEGVLEVDLSIIPTSTMDFIPYATSASSLFDYFYASDEVTPSYDFRTSIFLSTIREPKDFPSLSSVLSAKELPSVSPTFTASVPYVSDDYSASILPYPSLYQPTMVWSESIMTTPLFPSESVFLSTIIWSESYIVETTPVLPDLASSTAFEAEFPSVLSEYFMTSTSLPDIEATKVLEEPYSTPSPEILSMSLVSDFDVSTPTFTLPVVPLEPTPVLSVVSSSLDIVPSVFVDVTAYPTTSLYDNITYRPEEETLETEEPVATTALMPTYDNETISVEDTINVTTEGVKTTLVPETETEIYVYVDNATEVVLTTDNRTIASEYPGVSTTAYIPIDSANFTDTEEPMTTEVSVLDVNVTDMKLDEVSTTSISVDFDGLSTALPLPTPDGDYILNVTTTDSITVFSNVTFEEGLVTPLNETGLDTKTEITLSPVTESFNFTVTDEEPYGVDNVTSIPLDGYNETVTVPPDLVTPYTETVTIPPDLLIYNKTFTSTSESVTPYNETITVPPDLGYTLDMNLTVDSTQVTDNITLVYTDSFTPVFDNMSTVTTDEAYSPEISTRETMLPNISSSVDTTQESSSTSPMPVYNVSVIDITPFNATDIVTTDRDYVTGDVFDYNITSTTEVSDLGTVAINFTTLISTLFTTGIPLQNDSFTTEHVTTDVSLEVDDKTFNDSITTEAIANETVSFTTAISSATPDTIGYTEYPLLNDTVATQVFPEKETPDSLMTVTQPTAITVSHPATELTKDAESNLTSEAPRPTVIETMNVTEVTSSTKYVDVDHVDFSTVTSIINVTVTDEKSLHDTSTVDTTDLTSTTATAVSIIPPEVPLVPSDTTVSPENRTSIEEGTETDMSGSPTSVSLTTLFPDTTLQRPETEKPDGDLFPTIATEVEEPDQTGSPSKKDPVFDTTPLSPGATRPTGKDNATSISPPTPEGTAEIPSGDSAVCGSSYCLNGGTCVIIDGHSICQCAFNYKGAYCELYFYIHKPYFVGASYLGVDVGRMSLREGVQVYVQFTSQSANGLVAYSEGPGDVFFMLLLRNSLLQFVFSCGLQTVSFLQGNEKLSRNFRTDVSVRMWWTPYIADVPWGSGKCSASLQVNDTAPIYSEQRSSSSTVLLGILYLGGLPSFYSSPLVVKAGFLPRLHGCISILEVNGVEVDTWVSAVSGEGVQECGSALCPPGSCRNGGSCIPGPAFWSCSCPPGYHGELCERGECMEGQGCNSGRCVPRESSDSLCLCPQHRHGLYCELERVVERPSYSGTVQGYSSYSVYRLEYDTTHSLALKLHFTTRALQQIGLLAYLGNPVRSACQDFLALSLVRGHLMLTWDLGAGPRRIMTPLPLDSTLHTHSALIGRRGKRAWLSVDSQPNMTSLSPGYLSSLNTNNLLYIGGHASWNMSHLPADMWRHEGFRGCVFDLRVAPSPEGPWTALRLAQATNVKECGTDECKQHSCKNGGRCVGLGATLRCDCAIGWKGPQCETPSHVCDDGGGGSCSPGASCMVGGSRPSCLCQLGKSGPLCEKEVNITDPMFSGRKSFLSLQAGNLRNEARVRISFKPSHKDGILFLALPRAQPGDFLALILVNGSLQLSYHLGWRAPGLIVIQSQDKVTLNEWQSATFTRRGSDAVLNFKGRATTAPPAHPRNTLLNVHPEVFIGGAPDLSVVPSAVGPVASRIPFRGCVREVMINDHDYDLSAPLGGDIVRGAGLTDCDGTACGRHVCLHGGTCTPVGDTFVCSCTPEYTGARCQLSKACLDHSCTNGSTCIPWDSLGAKKRKKKKRQLHDATDDLPYQCLCPPGLVGERCQAEKEISSVRFSGESFAVVFPGPFGNPVPDSDSLAANFSTKSLYGLILWRGEVDSPGEDYLGVGLVGGQIKVVWYLGGGSAGQLTTTGPVVSDGSWHSLVVARTDATVTVFLDGRAIKGRIPGSYIQLNDPKGIIFVGGFYPGMSVTSGTEGHFRGSFVGCIRDLVVHQSSSPVRFSALKQGRDLQPCSLQ
ncbi:protein eyes shut-like [Macrobrachium rosenbergii]|uniref:protein eyes shut-like n=1 Tax=Macrobrachium rosenbergii TaxID=79674 RepID=UPI0034D540F7